MPRSRFTITLEDRVRVRQLAAIGLSDDDIASQLRLPLRKMQKLFHSELKEGAAAGREHALKTLHDIATGGENLGALTFWVKARCGWRDTGTVQSAILFTRHVTRFMPQPPSSASGNSPQPQPAPPSGPLNP
jgi:hypothetical protein